jgi:DNA-binding XRE family transcriptional regulator
MGYKRPAASSSSGHSARMRVSSTARIHGLPSSRTATMLVMTEVGDRLKRIRRRAMLTQGQLATNSGVGITTINRIEKGRVEDPHFSTLRKLARACGADPAELIED